MNYGIFGGQYVPQELLKRLDEIEHEFNQAIQDEDYKQEFIYYLKNYVGRPSPLYYAKNLSRLYGGAKIYLKREDLNHTGSHKINNAIGQVLLAKRLNKTHIIAETGAGQHGVATATVCAMFNLKCTIFMGEEDMRKQSVNVEKIKLLGAEVISVTEGSKTLKEAVDVAFQYLLDHDDVYYLIGSAVGPHPYPQMVKYFQQVIGEETRKQILAMENTLPKAVVACVGGGSNSIGMFSGFIHDKLDIYGVEGAGYGIESKMHASAIANNNIGIIHGMKTYAMTNENGEIAEAYSISSGLDYPGIGPEHAHYYNENLVHYDSVTDKEAIEGFKDLCKSEGIIPALESSHALAYTKKIAKKYKPDDSIVVSLSGRGDKDVSTILNYQD
ncbi:tryptophan synthase beta chain [Breznakia sp. PF5-3]|uniref:tryptophan synthase subunit beta n=1 Tax=unclassified Breznakia TaxID=2623764 RepID=UPI002405A5C0|nr:MULTISPECIES: tryptophan synthase subunit beta [unclassified Breznakia]MDF9824174.1 tryptophan synthase beta chain [Breznakia sp. PM6-1]MDF9834972.1 tryptophan synthase beta chain [Breznakia sp. PF5-3]MDF9837159.1 tryptophan synthase beta chain [Breznakia sp. PFB2-8]MDF9859149.1 tryptophan synthase beta chain [Breznakia sp. PH5-24]